MPVIIVLFWITEWIIDKAILWKNRNQYSIFSRWRI